MAAQHFFSNKFVRKTQLSANEYHKNFFKLDVEIITAISSAEADKITPLMSKIYLRLVNAPNPYWERAGVLRFEAQCREGKQVKAWDMLCEVVGVASATANKAVTWLHDSGIIGYFAGKNGVGIRIFLNRASSSIGARAASTGQKILHFAPASSDEAHASRNEPALNDSFAVLEVLDTDLKPHAPQNGTDTTPVDKKVSDSDPQSTLQPPAPNWSTGMGVTVIASPTRTVSMDEIVARLKTELEPCVNAAATQAATQTAAREIARTREWFETKALPKAVRVAQHETYDLLRKYGTLNEQARRTRADLEVGRAPSDFCTPPVAHALTTEEIRETAETCLAFLEAQGKAVDVTLAEINSAGGGWLLPEDAPKVRAEAERLLSARIKGSRHDEDEEVQRR